MAKHVDATDGFTIKDLLSENGITFDIGEQYCDDEDEELPYSESVQLSNEEMLNMLNMNGMEDEENEKDTTETDSLCLCGMSFAKLKTKMTNVTADNKVLKFVKQKGAGEIVPYNAQITIHYIGYFEDRDEPFDSTYFSGKPRTLRLGQNLIIPGLEIGIRGMQKHEIATFLIHPDFAYKAIGCPPRIPPNEEVVFVVHLIDFLDDGSADTYQNLTIEEQQSFPRIVQSVTHMLASAKSSFKKYNVKQAIREYRKAIDWLEKVKLKDNIEEEEMNMLLTRAYTNLAVCYNKIELPRLACIACNQVPQPSAKSHYNMGKALLYLGEYTQAMKELQKAYKLEPQNETIKKSIQQTNLKQRQYLEIEKRLWSNCLQTKNEKKEDTEFRKAARDLCETMINSNDIMRQPLPEGFTEEEHQILREEAALLGLSVVTHTRYNKQIVYLQKNKK